MSSFEQLVFEIIAKDAQASAAFARFRRQVDDTSKSVDKSSSSLDKNAQALDKNKTHATSAMGALIGVGTALAPISAGAVAAGAGFAAFGALAVPSVMKITKALGATAAQGGLAGAWVTLDNRQKVALQGLLALKGQFTDLAHAMEPRTFQVFNTALGFANSLLGPTGKLAASAGLGIESFLVQFSAHSGLQQFVTFLSGIARPALASLGSDVTHIAHAVFQLIQSFAGVGLIELRLLNDVFTALDASITFLTQHAPGLAGVAVGIGGLALALAKIGALGKVLELTGLATIATQMTGFAAATKGATLAEKGMLATTTALDAISPLGWAVLATAGLTGLVIWLNRFKSATAVVTKQIEEQNHAVGFNTFGYEAAAQSIDAYNQKQQQQKTTLVNLHTGITGQTVAVGDLTGATAELTAATARNVQAFTNQSLFLSVLEKKYGLTRDQAVSLAVKSGVLVDQVNKGGSALHDSVTQAEAYANANLKAQQPTSQLAKDMADFANKTLTATDRTKALTAALTLFFNPAVTADQDTIQLKNDQVALAKALDASGGKTGLLTQKQRDARSAFDTYISQVAQTAQDTFNATGKTGDYTKVIDRALPFLERAAGHNKALREEIQRLIDTEKNIRTEHVNISVLGTGNWRITHGLGARGTGVTAAAGGLIRQGTGPTADDVPVWASKGEYFVKAAAVAKYGTAMMDMINAGRFAEGGVVGSYSGGLGGLSPWLRSENAATLRAIEAGVAAAVVAAMRAAQQGGGGPFPNIPGGGSSSANARLARQMYPAWASGALWNAWNYVAMRESGWNSRAMNPSSGALGIAQALGHGVAGGGGSLGNQYGGFGLSLAADQLANSGVPQPQIAWFHNYAQSVYGGPIGAAAHERAFNWYDGGSGPQFLPRGLSLAMNGTGAPERVLSPGESRGLEKRLDRVIALLEAAPGLQAAATTRALNGLVPRIPAPRARGR